MRVGKSLTRAGIRVPVCLHTGAYDSRRRRMIIFGGQRGAGTLGDTWALDLNTQVWHELAPSDGPEGRKYPASVYDKIHDRFLELGGDTGTGKTDGVWALNLADESWAELGGDQGPPARVDAVAVYVPTERRLILFGGTGDENLNDVWSLLFPTPVPTSVESVESP